MGSRLCDSPASWLGWANQQLWPSEDYLKYAFWTLATPVLVEVSSYQGLDTRRMLTILETDDYCIETLPDPASRPRG